MTTTLTPAIGPAAIGRCAFCGLELVTACTHTTAYPGLVFCGSLCIERMDRREERHRQAEADARRVGSATMSSEDCCDEARDEGYSAGHRAAWFGLLQRAIAELSGSGLGYDQPKMALATATLQLEGVRASLREVCRDHGDNDWDDDLDLSDVIEKHLAPYLDEAAEDDEG